MVQRGLLSTGLSLRIEDAMAEFLEAVMLICFGLSWPMNAYKAAKARTAAGTSWQFILLITLGYVAGIAAKFVSGQINWVLVVYFINMVALAANWAVYFRNVKLDAIAAGRYQEKHDERREVVRKQSVNELLEDGGKDPATAKYGTPMSDIEDEAAKKRS